MAEVRYCGTCGKPRLPNGSHLYGDDKLCQWRGLEAQLDAITRERDEARSTADICQRAVDAARADAAEKEAQRLWWKRVSESVEEERRAAVAERDVYANRVVGAAQERDAARAEVEQLRAAVRDLLELGEHFDNAAIRMRARAALQPEGE